MDSEEVYILEEVKTLVGFDEILVTFPAVPQGILEESIYVYRSQLDYIKGMAEKLKQEGGLEIIIGDSNR